MTKRTGCSIFEMGKIKVLPDNLANQIAAGEVVERPASVIKELVENAIDARSSRISVEVELGGRRLMRVADDGEGMNRDDSILAFERHATSKIRELDDLARIETLGFRGEALASIASVARVELITRTEGTDAASRVAVEGGTLLDVKDAARDRGTTISVRDLFFNTPARRKFMRSEATENYHLTNIVTHYALAHPEIAFTLTNNGREVIRVSPARDLRERAFQIFGGSLLESLLPVNGGREFIATVTGYVSAPRERRTTRDSQFFFVNQRFVKDRIISDGLREGFRSVLPHGVYPVAFLFISLPIEEIDVNVHPAKTEIRFRRTEAVKDVIAQAVRESLVNAGLLAEQETEMQSDSPGETLRDSFTEPDLRGSFPAEVDYKRSEFSSAVLNRVHPAETPPSNIGSEEHAGETLFSVVGESLDFNEIATRLPYNDLPISEAPPETSAANAPEIGPPQGYAVLPPVDSAAVALRAVEVESISEPSIRPVAQLHDSFIIAVDSEGLLLIDQHVAHERILFDKFRNREDSRPVESQNLLLPETLDLSPAQAESFTLVENELAGLGFGIIRLSGRTIAIKAVPMDVQPAEARNLFSEILDTVEPEKKGRARLSLRDEIAASLACKAAVKINMPLTQEKMAWLIDRLLLTSSPTTCPHGRPIVLRLTMKDIERRFHRT